MKRREIQLKYYKIYMKFICSGLIVLIIPLTILIIIYSKSINEINKQTYEQNITIMKNSANNIDSLINNLDTIAYYFETNSKISRYLNTTRSYINGKDTSLILEAQNEIWAMVVANNNIRNIQIYSDNSNTLIDCSSIAAFIERYYGSSFSIGGMSYEKWYNTILCSNEKFIFYPHLTAITHGITKRTLIYSRRIPITDNSSNNNRIIFFIDEEQILQNFNAMEYDTGGFFYLLDKEWNIITENNCSLVDQPLKQIVIPKGETGYKISSINSQKMFLVYFYDTSKNWTYVAAIPTIKISMVTKNIRFFIDIMLVLTVVLGSLLVIINALRLSKPFIQIYNVLNYDGINIQDVDFVYEISKLVKSNDNLREDMKQQIPAIKTAAFYNLLFGEVNHKEEIKENLERMAISQDAAYYAIIILAFNDLDMKLNIEEISAQKVFISSLLRQNCSCIQDIYNVSFEHMVTLMAVNEKTRDDAKLRAETIIENTLEPIIQNINYSISFAGDIIDDIINLSDAYFNAQKALNVSNYVFDGHKIQWFDMVMPCNEGKFQYSSDTESKVALYTITGNYSQLENLFQNILHDNKWAFENNNLVSSTGLLHVIYATLLQILNDYPELCNEKVSELQQLILRKINDNSNLLQTYYILKKTFLVIAHGNELKLYGNRTEVADKIKDYILANYNNPQLSLKSVADEFSITEVYLSRVFKQSTGENFSKYIEKLRIEKAKRLLEEKRMLISEVAVEVGYNSPQVFRRAYRRICGQTPTES